MSVHGNGRCVLTRPFACEDLCTFVTISRWILIMRNVADKCCSENRNTHFIFYKCSMNTMRRMCKACWIPKATNTHTVGIFNTYCFFTEKRMVMRTRLGVTLYEVSSNSIRIGTVVVVRWVGCVCSQSWHVRTCLSNSWHKLQVAAFAQLAAVSRRSNTCVYVIAIFTMCESTEQRICIKVLFWNRKNPLWKLINYCSKHTVKMQWVVHRCLTGSVDLKRVEPPLSATPARDDRQRRETRKWLLKLEQSFSITGDWQYKR